LAIASVIHCFIASRFSCDSREEGGDGSIRTQIIEDNISTFRDLSRFLAEVLSITRTYPHIEAELYCADDRKGDF